MRLKWLSTSLALIALNLAKNAHAQCHCALFLVTSETWQPDYLAFQTGHEYEVNCSYPMQAEEQCRRLCTDEVTALNDAFASQPHLREAYYPEQDLPCEVLPAHTTSFFTTCQSKEWLPSTARLSSSVCCHPEVQVPVWCDAYPSNSLGSGDFEEEGRAAGQTVIERKIDTGTDKNAIETNEIEGSTKPSLDEGSGSWITYILKFVGYNSIGEMIQNMDIFSLPGRIQSAVKTYNDEISMGQCYMEFTTYSVFKQDGILANVLRSRRDLEILVEAAEGRATGKQGQNSAIQSLVGGLIGMLEGSPSTKQYADVLKQLMPVVMGIYSSDDPSSAITSFVSQSLGPLLSQAQFAGAPNRNDIVGDNSNRWPNLKPNTTPAPRTTPRPPPRPATGSSGSSPITSLILQLVKSYLSSPGSGPAPIPPTPPPTRPPVSHRPPVSSAASSSAIGNILGLLFGGGQSQNLQSRPRPKPPVKKTPKPQIAEKYDNKKSFVEMVLEFIRPVFISIVGKAPGESGVASIREVTRLSSLGRVDDTLVEEVLSPYFCLKNYVVNKAWTLTERGVSSVVTTFTPEEKARMMRMMKEDSDL